MNAKTIKLQFEGYWNENDINNLPKKSGVYVIYEGIFDKFANKLAIFQPLFIGEAQDVKAHITKHDQWPVWRRYCRPGTQIYISIAPAEEDRERAGAALVYKHKPPANGGGKDEFPFCATTIETEGKIACLERYFTVQKTD